VYLNFSLYLFTVAQVNKDGNSVHSSWYLTYIDVLNMSTGVKSTFQYNNWVGTDWWTQTYGVTLAESNSMQVRQFPDNFLSGALSIINNNPK
jgi:hypothetical protein